MGSAAARLEQARITCEDVGFGDRVHVEWVLARHGQLHDVAAYEADKRTIRVFRLAGSGDCGADGDVAAFGEDGDKGEDTNAG